MRMGDEDMADGFARSQGRQQGLQMIRVVGSGIQYGDTAGADDKAAGSGIGEGAGVFACHASDKRRYLLADAVCRLEIMDKRYFAHLMFPLPFASPADLD